jgi:hypothetical protein
MSQISTSGNCMVFLTSTEYDGGLGGLAGADSKCQKLADNAGLTGIFRAWLSDSTVSAGERLTHSVVPYSDVKDRTIADNWDDLTDGTLRLPITVDETGVDWDEDRGHCDIIAWLVEVWTGTSTDGSTKAANCNDWTDNQSMDAGSSGHFGYYCYETEAWTDPTWMDPSASCSSSKSLYCFQQ